MLGSSSDRPMSVKEAALVSGYSPTLLYGAIHSGRLACRVCERAGRRRYEILEKDLDAWLNYIGGHRREQEPLSIRRAGRLAGYSESRIYRAVREGELPSVRCGPGRGIGIYEDDLNSWIDKRKGWCR